MAGGCLRQGKSSLASQNSFQIAYANLLSPIQVYFQVSFEMSLSKIFIE
jgi:hypothetical protein